MPSLKEIKGRITSVGGTLKITSAMKLVASAKLHKAQAAIEGALPYQQQLEGIMRMAVSGEVRHPLCTPHAERKTVALVSIASNTSLCGGYNAGVIRQTVAALEQYREEGLRVRLIVMGRKPDQALVKWAKGQGSWLSLERDYVERGDKPAYADASQLALSLADDFLEGRLDGVELIYMHLKTRGAASGPRARRAGHEDVHRDARRPGGRTRRPHRGDADGDGQRQRAARRTAHTVQQGPPGRHHQRVARHRGRLYAVKHFS